MGGRGQPSDDDPIRRLRHTYSERMAVERRRDRIETRVLAVFLWFFIAFWSLGIYEMAFGDAHMTFRNAHGIIEVLAAGVFGLVVAFVGWPVHNAIVPRGEPGLLQWWDDRRKPVKRGSTR